MFAHENVVYKNSAVVNSCRRSFEFAKEEEL